MAEYRHKGIVNTKINRYRQLIISTMVLIAVFAGLIRFPE
jgi:hypothetical protein